MTTTLTRPNAATLITTLVNPHFFVEATRESGYKGTTSAVAELIDNSLQASASNIHIHFVEQSAGDIWAYILDDGEGMDVETLALAPQFGGSSRFDNREGMGRFGMGLPNASVSQCRQFEIYTRRKTGPLLYTYLDLDQVAGIEPLSNGFLSPIEVGSWPDLPEELAAKLNPDSSGTLVVWKKFDRPSARDVNGLRKTVSGFLGQAFRNFIYKVNGKPAHLITVNGEEVQPYDPLFLDQRALFSGAEERAEQDYEIPIKPGSKETGRLTVKFSMLPVEDWQQLSNQEKHKRRITTNRGFSIVRAGREIEVTDRYFLVGRAGSEGRIENNDAWWGCEISFEPKLDEVFGVTHTKQDIRPNLQALQKLREEITATVSTLRKEYETRRIKKGPAKTHPSEEKAHQNDKFLPPLPAMEQDPAEARKELSEYLEKYKREEETEEDAEKRVHSKLFTIELESGKDGPFYRTAYLLGNTIVYVNTDHPFYTNLYSKVEDQADAREAVEMLLFALARGERMAVTEPDGRKWYKVQIQTWSGILLAYLSK